jgi:hypothetical protein
VYSGERLRIVCKTRCLVRRLICLVYRSYCMADGTVAVEAPWILHSPEVGRVHSDKNPFRRAELESVTKRGLPLRFRVTLR